jgi:hypothetical protein
MLLFQLLFWLLFDICANHVSKITETILFSNIKIIHHTAQVCHIFIWLFSHHKMFQATVQQAPSTFRCVPYGLKKGHQTYNQCLASNTFHIAGWQITQLTTVNCCHQSTYWHELNREANLHLDSSTEEQDNAFRGNQILLSAININFISYIHRQ